MEYQAESSINTTLSRFMTPDKLDSFWALVCCHATTTVKLIWVLHSSEQWSLVMLLLVPCVRVQAVIYLQA